jgi:nucleoside-diphosphate-sugar epimerase
MAKIPDAEEVSSRAGEKFLFIGGSGYIGSFVVPRLRAEGFVVDVCDIGQRGHPDGEPPHPFHYRHLDTAAPSKKATGPIHPGGAGEKMLQEAKSYAGF